MFERLPPPRLLAWHRAAVAIGGVGSLTLGCALSPYLLGARPPASSWARLYAEVSRIVGPLPAATSLGVVLLSPALLAVALRAWRRHRFGSCTVTGDVLTFSTGGRARRIPLAEITERVETPHGLQVRTASRSALRDLLDPLLLPAPTADERRWLLRLLEPDGRHAAARFGPPRWLAGVATATYLSALALLLLGALAAWAVTVTQASGGLGLALLGLVGPPALWVWSDAIRPRLVPLEVTGSGLLLRDDLLPWEELHEVAVGEGVLVLSTRAERVRLVLGEEAAPAARAIEARARAVERDLTVRPLLPHQRHDVPGGATCGLLALAAALGLSVAVPLLLGALGGGDR